MSKHYPNCLITGCAFVDSNGQRALWGDLHETERAWIFNAVGEWEYDARPQAHEKQLISDGTPFYEKRGVIVLDKGLARLNLAAREYLK